MCCITLDTLEKAASLVTQDVWVYHLDDGSFWHNKGRTMDDWKASMEASGDWEFLARSLDSWGHVDMTSAYPMEVCVNGRWVRICCEPVREGNRVVAVIGVETDVTMAKSVVPRLHEMRRTLSQKFHEGAFA